MLNFWWAADHVHYQVTFTETGKERPGQQGREDTGSTEGRSQRLLRALRYVACPGPRVLVWETRWLAGCSQNPSGCSSIHSSSLQAHQAVLAQCMYHVTSARFGAVIVPSSCAFWWLQRHSVWEGTQSGMITAQELQSTSWPSSIMTV